MKNKEACFSFLLNSLLCVEMLIYTLMCHVTELVCVSDSTSGDLSGFIALKAKLTLVSLIQHHLLKNGR